MDKLFVAVLRGPDPTRARTLVVSDNDNLCSEVVWTITRYLNPIDQALRSGIGLGPGHPGAETPPDAVYDGCDGE